MPGTTESSTSRRAGALPPDERRAAIIAATDAVRERTLYSCRLHANLPAHLRGDRDTSMRVSPALVDMLAEEPARFRVEPAEPGGPRRLTNTPLSGPEGPSVGSHSSAETNTE